MNAPDGLVEGYGGRETYHEREGLYAWAYALLLALGLGDGDLVVDVGAGNCDLDVYLRRQGWFGRYLPVDACIDPHVDLEVWVPPHSGDFFVCLDTLEHLHHPAGLLRVMRAAATKAVLVSTADAATIDVLALHPSHFSALTGDDLHRVGYRWVSHPLGSYAQLMGWWTP